MSLKALSIGVDSFGRSPKRGQEPELDAWPPLPFVKEQVASLAAAMTELGYECDITGPLTAKALGQRIFSTLDDAKPDDILVCHVITHGHISRSGALHAVGSDGRFDSSTDVGDWLKHVVDRPNGQPTLFLLDLCNAGTAARLSWQLRVPDEKNLAWVIAACQPDRNAYMGRFTHAVTQVVRAMSGHSDNVLDFDDSVSHIPLPTVAREIRRAVTDLVARENAMPQEVIGTRIDVTADFPDLPFFPNRHFAGMARQPLSHVQAGLAPFLEGLNDIAPARASRVPKQAEPKPEHEGLDAGHFIERAAGFGPLGYRGKAGSFTGRARELRILTNWIDRDEDGVHTRVVIGSPGVGKSALLGIVVCAAHPTLSAATERLWNEVEVVPRRHDDLVAVHARQRTVGAIVTSLGQQLFEAQPDRNWDVAALLAAITERRARPIVIIDALDEAVDPLALMNELLLPLARLQRDERPACRLLVATRPWPEFEPLVEEAAGNLGVIDLDDVPRRTLQYDLEDYVNRLLRTDDRYGEPDLAPARAGFAAQVAASLSRVEAAPTHGPAGDVKWGEFLVAGLYTYHLINESQTIRDPDAASELGRRIPRTLPEILELDLAARDVDDWVLSALIAVSHGRGAGIPAATARRLVSAVRQSRAAPTQAEMSRALETASFYLRRSADSDGTTLYRLFHQGLADHLARTAMLGWSSVPGFEAGQAAAVYEQLIACTNTPTGRDWNLAEPYVMRHAIAYAEDAGKTDELLDDPEFLLRANPALVVPIIESTLAARDERQAETDVRQIYLALLESQEGGLPLDDRARFALLAARAGDRQLAERLTRPHGQPLLAWRPLWTAGGASQITEPDVSNKVRLGLICGSRDGIIHAWELMSGLPAGPQISADGQAINALAAADVDRRLLACAGCDDGVIRVYDMTSGQLVYRMSGHNGSVRAVAITAVDGTPMLVSGGDDRTVRRWDLLTGTLHGEPLAPFMSGPILTLACTSVASAVGGQPSGDPPLAVVGTASGLIIRWDLRSNRADRRQLPLGSGHVRIRSIRCLRRGRRSFALCGSSGGVLVSNLDENDAAPSVLSAGSAMVSAIAAATIDRRDVVAAGGSDGRVRLWNLDEEVEISSWTVASQRPGSVRAIEVTEVAGKPAVVVLGADGYVRSWVGVHDDRRELPTVSADQVQAMALADVASLPLHQPLDPAGSETELRRTAIVAVARSSEVKGVLVTGFHNGDVAVWDERDGSRVLHETVRAGDPITRVAVGSVGGTALITASSRFDSAAWHLKTRKRLSAQTSSELPAWLATAMQGSDDKVVDYTPASWTIRKGKPVVVTGIATGDVHVGVGPSAPRWHAHDGPITAITCARLDDTLVIATGASDGQIRLWDVETLGLIDSIFVPGTIRQIALEPDGLVIIHTSGEIIAMAHDDVR
jgi:WD40 repeat protein